MIMHIYLCLCLCLYLCFYATGSIPLALAEAVKSGKVKKGDIIACAGFGAGLSWASVILKWG